MRTKKALYNNFAAAFLQLTILLFGLILPRLMIETYGSEINGLVSSTKQMVSYLKYLELGVTSALIYTLYEPLANNDYNIINSYITRAKKEYEKISLGYFLGIVLLSLIYPFLLKDELGNGLVLFLVLFLGIYGALDFYTLSKYRVLLTADQRYYIVNLITIITTILQNIAAIVLILLNQSVLLVVFIPTVFLPIRSLFLRYYIKKNYVYVNYSSVPSTIKLESRKDAFIDGLSSTLNVSLPLVVVSLVVSLEMASVFSIYSMVFIGLTGIVSVFTTGMVAGFGNVFANNERQILLRSYDYYEFLLYMLLTILYSLALALIIPFIKVYIGNNGVADINYVYPTVGILFTIWSVSHNARIPNETMVKASGNWKLVTTTNIVQAILLIFSTTILGYFLGIDGILIAMIVCTLYKTNTFIHISNSKIIKISSKISTLRLLRSFIIIFLVNSPFIFGLINIKVDSVKKWLAVAVITAVWALLITIIINYLFDKKTINDIYKRYIKKK